VWGWVNANERKCADAVSVIFRNGFALGRAFFKVEWWAKPRLKIQDRFDQPHHSRIPKYQRTNFRRGSLRDFLLSSGICFGKPQSAQRTQRKQHSVPSVPSVVNLLCNNPGSTRKKLKSHLAAIGTVTLRGVELKFVCFQMSTSEAVGTRFE